MIKAVSEWRTAGGKSKALAKLSADMRACLDARGGEVSARTRAAALGAQYRALDAEGREQFFRLLATHDVDGLALDRAVAKLRAARGDDERSLVAREVRELTLAPWVRLLTQFNGIPGGVKFLVDLRADLLRILDRAPVFARIDADLRQILATWFDIGFLELREIGWDAPASFLEKLAGYEAVHEMRDWRDLKHRLQGDRRCFAFVHPAMPDEPLIFVEVALADTLSAKIADVLDREASPLADQPTTAIFYSISNCQTGLAGISFGNALIKRVVDRLSSQFRSLRTFATLSPVPGFLAWLAGRVDAGDGFAAALAKRGWQRDAQSAEALRLPLTRLCAHYLLREKRGERTARDPVEHFHLSNGARLERINWLADLSPKGLRESAGIMVNYLYAIDKIDENHEAYATEGRIAASSAVRDLAKTPR